MDKVLPSIFKFKYGRPDDQAYLNLNMFTHLQSYSIPRFEFGFGDNFFHHSVVVRGRHRNTKTADDICSKNRQSMVSCHERDEKTLSTHTRAMLQGKHETMKAGCDVAVNSRHEFASCDNSLVGFMGYNKLTKCS